jgi:Fe-S cluster assembly protein SufD
MNKTINVHAGVKKYIPIIWTGRETELNFTIWLSGKGAEVNMPITLIGKGSNSVSIQVSIYHKKPDTKSSLTIKGAMWDRSKVNFNGLVKIEKGAVRSNAWLSAKLLLLSDLATGTAIPNLEIEENEVKAGHGVTISKVSETEIFYIMSRGLSRTVATEMIVEGFLK